MRCSPGFSFWPGEGAGRRIPLAIRKEDAMAKSSNWQEHGTRIGGILLDADGARMFVEELKRRVKDPEIIKEIEAFLTENAPLSQRT
jgi:hypothetical protein